MQTADIRGSAALVTGGANGIGAAVARRLAGLGADVMIADVDTRAGNALAEKIGGRFIRCDVSEWADNQAAVDAVVDAFGGLRIVALNAGISTGHPMGEGFDAKAYRRAMGINLDGVVYGAQAALPALRAGGGGDIIATASIAGLVATPLDPVYGANKHAVVGLVRALGPAWAPMGVRVNALCPGFADTAIIDVIRKSLTDRQIEILDMDSVAEAFLAILTADGTGECWPVLPGVRSAPFQFNQIPDLQSIYPNAGSIRPSARPS